jgi:hypothetical protein
MAYDGDLLYHIQAVNDCIRGVKGTAELNPENLNLQVRARGRCLDLLPQFIFPKEGSVAFSPKIVAEAYAFCGWRSHRVLDHLHTRAVRLRQRRLNLKRTDRFEARIERVLHATRNNRDDRACHSNNAG